MRAFTLIQPLFLATGFMAITGCSIRGVAVNALGNAMADGGSVYASDEDPDLVRDAIPFGLKTTEGLIEASPRHRGLLKAAASGFVQYAYAFVQQEADLAEANDLARATALRERARKLFLRGRDYGLRGLEVDLPGFSAAFSKDPQATLARARRHQVDLLYWTAAGWAGAMALAINDSSLSADQPLVLALLERALALDEGFELGSIHDVLGSYESARRSAGGSLEKARGHFDRSVAIAHGRRAWPFVSLAESVEVARQDKGEFVRLLNEALAVDVEREKSQRLANLIAQRRARWLLGRTEELFIE